jgi:hypothetical protein
MLLLLWGGLLMVMLPLLAWLPGVFGTVKQGLQGDL